ncbi:Uncharacterised protein [Corynebacterium kutscheri]|uniref:SCP domain-containing protein n=1 Tax=Corynebacterium kutscheri TaxID=35755 RepID=A0A0F6R159_9CORY|nr:CAP domain-containing protein [Corynebacterium kutscheri]AKE40833.1 hypothetical protein UL82_03090 [Corynebacterium kutscheri]VEH09130.1 Uncharacterised protein [Corynebacterium kutscheri]VEH82465.1 Uncharacterised protein [Corynebacterium kutscheri]
MWKIFSALKLDRLLTTSPQDLINVLAAIIVVVSGVLAGIAVNNSDNGSSETEKPAPIYPHYPLENFAESSSIQAALNEGLLLMYAEAGHVSSFDPTLEDEAQRLATTMATSGRFIDAAANATTLRARLSNDQASATTFLTQWRNDPSSWEQLAKNSYSHYGIGVASAAGNTYAVIRLS